MSNPIDRVAAVNCPALVLILCVRHAITPLMPLKQPAPVPSPLCSAPGSTHAIRYDTAVRMHPISAPKLAKRGRCRRKRAANPTSKLWGAVILTRLQHLTRSPHALDPA
ncbi:hypothetical protein GT037_002801 [Alternaria burnsii]|uniref:Uncharacterized protein n=1 Tax=Alternaria burnsii TaxID=1187904 RepID=A0A8H7BGI1_9PLEO|nr:uncharacterized protein GT037_002801 [Alternaria burnsii]KAF7679053.1 hypothetical protein GT037_002801 [Alternaria burnsii]